MLMYRVIPFQILALRGCLACEIDSNPPKPDNYQVIVIHNCVFVQINLFKFIYYLYLDRIGEIKPLIRTKSRFIAVHSRSLVQLR